MTQNADTGGHYYGILAPGWASDTNLVMCLRSLAADGQKCYSERDAALFKRCADRIEALSHNGSSGAQ